MNPFETSREMTVAPSANTALAATDQQRAIAEVQASMMIARAAPRDEAKCMNRILRACQRKTLAANALYEYARGGTDISGPSIRLAEAMAQQWGNLAWGLRELEQREGMSIIQAFAHDLETNTRREVVFQVPHERHTKSGSYKLKDPRDIYELVANNGMRRVRACLLGVIPGDVVEAAVDACNRTLVSAANEETRDKIIESFERFGVTVEMIEAHIQRNLDAITPNQVAKLKRIWASLRDGVSSVEDWFDPNAGKVAPQMHVSSVTPQSGPHMERYGEQAKQGAAAGSDRLTPEEQKAAKRASAFSGSDKPYSAQREVLLAEKEFARAGGEPGGPELDTNDVPYNPEFHSGGDKRKHHDGSWRMKRSYDPERYREWIQTIQGAPKGREDSVAWFCDQAEEAESIELIRKLKAQAMDSGLDEAELNTVLDVLDARLDALSPSTPPAE